METVAIISQMKRREAVMVATTYPMKPRALEKEPGWPALNYKEKDPCLETVAIISQMKKGEAVMVATTCLMKPRALAKNLGDLHFMKRRKSHAWKQWPSSVR